MSTCATTSEFTASHTLEGTLSLIILLLRIKGTSHRNDTHDLRQVFIRHLIASP